MGPVATYEREVSVAAAPERVWAVLEDLASWPEWTASMSSLRRTVDGPLRVGERVRVRQPRLPPARWTVTGVEPGRSFSWSSGSPVLRSTGDHEIRPAPGGSTVLLRFAQTGPLAPLVGLLLGGTVRRFVEMEAAGLRRRAESA